MSVIWKKDAVINQKDSHDLEVLLLIFAKVVEAKTIKNMKEAMIHVKKLGNYNVEEVAKLFIESQDEDMQELMDNIFQS